MSLCDWLLSNKFEVRVDKVELGKHYTVEPPITSIGSYVAYKGFGEKSLSYACFDIKINVSVVPLDKPFLGFSVDRIYRSDRVRSDPVSISREWSRLKQEIQDINRLIQEEGIVLQTRIRAEIPPVAVTSDSQYAKDVSKSLPKDLYQRIVDYAEEKGVLMPAVEPHG